MDERFITVQEAQDILRVTSRQVQYHAANGRIRSRKVGRRLELLEEDVHKLADELGADHKKPPEPSVELVHDTGPLIDYIRELNSQALLMSRRIGELEALLGQRLLPEDVEGLREQLAQAEARSTLLEEEAGRLRQQLEEAEKPWWKRMFE